ncbi:MAG: DinB family protein [Thermoanaerobaculia bacterium]|nr:DinB family protein [Thermoanaerobaculia bacterium]
MDDHNLPDDIQKLLQELDAAERDAETLVAGLSEAQGTWRPKPEAWSVAECLDHLATTNRWYVSAMQEPAERALRDGRNRRGPAKPGWLGGFFVSMIEPPPKWWTKGRAPRKIQPRPSPPLGATFANFIAGQAEVRTFLRTYAAIDLAGVRFPNPFIRGVRFSLATGLNVITAHERRHLLQAWRVRRALEASGTG